MVPPIKLDPTMPKGEIRIGVDPGEGDIGIPAHSDIFYEDGVLRSSTTAPAYGGISRELRLEDYVSVPVVSPAAYEVIRRALAEADARTGAAPMPPQDTKHGARTIAGHERVIENATLRLPSGERRALEPTSVEKITSAQKFGVDMPSAKPEWEDELLRPSALMRRLGYTAHPDACTHYRKRLMLGSTQWTCADCGVTL